MAKIPGGRRDKSQGTFARRKPGGVFFRQQRGEVLAKLHLSIKRYWRRPTRAGAWVERLFPNEEEGHQEELILIVQITIDKLCALHNVKPLILLPLGLDKSPE